jgi:hypothetical protein
MRRAEHKTPLNVRATPTAERGQAGVALLCARTGAVLEANERARRHVCPGGSPPDLAPCSPAADSPLSISVKAKAAWENPL